MKLTISHQHEIESTHSHFQDRILLFRHQGLS